MASVFIRTLRRGFSVPLRLTKTSHLGDSNQCAMSMSTVLQEVGKLQKPLDPADTTVSYKTGQLFLHKSFGYRGVILAAWKTKTFQSTNKPTTSLKDGDGEIDILCGDIQNPVLHPKSPELYYSVLVDASDSSYIRGPVDGVSFLGRDSGRGQGRLKDLYSYEGDLVIFTIPGVDYVHNSDILPYRLSDTGFPRGATLGEALSQVFRPPIDHELFPKFLTRHFDYGKTMQTIGLNGQDPAYTGTRTLHKWRKRNQRWLKPEATYQANSGDLTVTAIPFYMGAHFGEDADDHPEQRFWWRYVLKIENAGDKTIELVKRSWTVAARNGSFDKKTESGLEGRKIVLSKYNPCFQITCYCSLTASSGSIWGELTFEDVDGNSVECLVPHFPLQSKEKSSN